MKIIAIPYGTTKAHPANESWFKAVKVTKNISFLGFDAPWVRKMGPLVSQAVSFISSIFMPKADIYLLTSAGCIPAAILKKKLFKSKVITVNSTSI